MRTRHPKIRLTKSLLDAWLYSFKVEDGWDKFLLTLNREKVPVTEAMLDGIRFESCINNVLDGAIIDESHEWYKPVTELADYLHGSQKQVNLFREIDVNGQCILLHGVLDFLRAGVVFDTKFSKRYYLNKYLSSPQHPLYLTLVPEARRFEYLICDGKYIYKEIYPREIVPPIEPTIKNFMNFCDSQGLRKTLEEKWSVN